jgi:hypothetical protein
MIVKSPVRRDQDGSVTFLGKQEHEDEVLRSHYLLLKMRTKGGVMPPIPRGQGPKKDQAPAQTMVKSYSQVKVPDFKGLVN